MQKPIVVLAYLILFMGLASMVSALFPLGYSGNTLGMSLGLSLGVIANCAGFALLYVDRRLNDIEAKIDLLSASPDSTQPK